MTKQISDSAIFNNLIMSDKLKGKLQGIDFEKSTVPHSDISSEMSTIERRMKHPTRLPIVNLYESGKIIVINDRDVDLPTYLSTMAMRNRRGDSFTLVDITKFTTKNKNVSVNTLFALMQNAFILNEFEKNWDKYTGNAAFISLSSVIYSQLGMKVMDKLYSLNLHTVESDFVSYVLAKFFLINMAGRGHSSTTNNMAHKSCFHGTNLQLIEEKEAELEGNDKMYDSLITLMQTLNSLPEYKVKFRAYFENFIRMYGDSTVLAMDFLPAFYQMIFAVSVSGSLNKEYAIEKTVSSTALTKCYSSFSRII